MTEIITWICEPFNYDFMRRAIFVSLLIGSVCAVLSCYLVLKGWALMGDAISHAVLPGIVLSSVIGLPLAVGAFVSGLFCAYLTGYIRENSRIKEDTVMGIVFSGLFALGLTLFTYVDVPQHITHILFGSLLGITQNELNQSLVIVFITFLFLAVKWRDLLLYCFDPLHARVIGLSVPFLHYSLLSLVALAIVIALQAVGVVLVIAMLIGPGITAQLMTRHFPYMLITALGVSLFSSLIGVILSYHINGDSAPCIVLVQAGVFLLCLLYTRISIRKYDEQPTAK